MIALWAIVIATFLAASLGVAESASQRHPPRHKRMVHSTEYKPAALAKPASPSASQPSSHAAMINASQPALMTPVTESQQVERGSAVVLSPAPASVQRPSPPAEPQQQLQQEKMQQTPPQMAEPQNIAVLVNGILAVPGAATNTDTAPSKFSERNAADDRLITVAYTFKLLNPEERSAIYQTLKGQEPGGSAVKADMGTKVPLNIELRAVPDELIVRVPQTKGYYYMDAGNEILLVSPLTRVVVGVFSENLWTRR